MKLGVEQLPHLGPIQIYAQGENGLEIRLKKRIVAITAINNKNME